MSLPPLTPNGWLRFDIVESLVADLPRSTKILEIGAGEGATGVRLAERFDYVGLEPDPISCAKARERLDRIGRGKVLCTELGGIEVGTVFDLVCAFEVLEHLEDDVAALREWRQALREGGLVLVSVPVLRGPLRSADYKAGHYRRYEPLALAEVLTLAGFTEPRVLRYGFPLGYGLEAVRNLAARLGQPHGSKAEATAGSGRWLQPPQSLGWLTRLGTAPFRRLQRPFVNSRFGTGLVAVARDSAVEEAR